jgi:hypothetical protein
VESTYINDSEFGSGYTVKEYHSTKNASEEEWSNESIILKPLTFQEGHTEIVLQEDDMIDLRVVGIFIKVL